MSNFYVCDEHFRSDLPCLTRIPFNKCEVCGNIATTTLDIPLWVKAELRYRKEENYFDKLIHPNQK